MASQDLPGVVQVKVVRSAFFTSMILYGVFAAGIAFAQAPANPQAAPPLPATGNPNLVVASVKQEGGWRASKCIGGDVYNDQNQKIGSIDDLILSPDNKVEFAIVSVGGFLGMGSKLVAVPYDQIHADQSKGARKVVMANGSKDALNAQPSFTYGE